MFRRFLTYVFLILALIAALQHAAHAQTEPQLGPADKILTSLLSRGYLIVENERTWLGRQRILAQKDGMQREMVFVPSTGEILRDYSVQLSGSETQMLARTGQNRGVDSAPFRTSTGISGAADAAPSVGAATPTGDLLAPSDVGILP